MNQVGKHVEAETKIDSADKIAAWIKDLQSKRPTVGGSFKNTQDGPKSGNAGKGHAAAEMSRSATSSRGGTQRVTKTEHQRGGAPNIAAPHQTGSSHASSSAAANNRNGDVSITYNFNPKLSASMEHVNSNQRSGSDPQVKRRIETKTEAAVETETETADDDEAGLGEEISGEVTGEQPRAIQIHSDAAKAQVSEIVLTVNPALPWAQN